MRASLLHIQGKRSSSGVYHGNVQDRMLSLGGSADGERQRARTQVRQGPGRGETSIMLRRLAVGRDPDPLPLYISPSYRGNAQTPPAQQQVTPPPSPSPSPILLLPTLTLPLVLQDSLQLWSSLFMSVSFSSVLLSRPVNSLPLHCHIGASEAHAWALPKVTDSRGGRTGTEADTQATWWG